MLKLKEEIKKILRDTILDRFKIDANPVIEIPPKLEFGDFSSNLASILPKKLGLSIDEFVTIILSELSKKKETFKKVLKKGNFINFFLNDAYLFGQLKDVIKEGDRFGSSNMGKSKKVLVEFVSTNPTGPLNIVNARAAAVGDTLVKLLNFTGYKADAEFYINDAGRQMEMLGISAEKRFEELQGKVVQIPEDGYKGEYIKECVSKFINDEKVRGMSEEERIGFFKNYVKDEMIKWQKNSLERFGVRFKKWIGEKAILEGFSIQKVLEHLRGKGDVYEKDGAVWFNTTRYGDDKDRVLLKQDGTHTYIVSDASYHKNKFERGYEYLINLWGPDHHGDILRLKAAVEAFGFVPENLEIIIVQQVTLVFRGKKQKMSKRAGKFITLDSLLDKVDKDAVRFFFLMRKTTAHLDFDVELAKTLTLENPVYYTQYCHARTVNIFNFAEERGVTPADEPDLSLLTEPHEREIAKLVLLFPEVVQIAAERRDIHKVPHYLLDLSKVFHSYYQKVRIVIDDEPLTLARLLLVKAVKQVIKNGLTLIGVTAPERM
ncbi:MAG: arginine--tRNA ligase [Candidatus Cloacimonadota bacterium]|nr:MAG: arginine--tRNA ligase [Candidatus Cloacimonadota bacterium]